MADENKELDLIEQPTESNTAPYAPEAEAPAADAYNPAYPEEGQAPDFSSPSTTDTVGAPVDLASPDAAPEAAGEESHLETAEEDPTDSPGETQPSQPLPTAGAADAPAEDAAGTSQGTLDLSPTGETNSAEPASPSAALPAEATQAAGPGEPADLAGAPSAGKPIDTTVATVPTDAGYPVPKDDHSEPPVHPATGLPMVNDGLGEDKGKVADTSATSSSSSAPSGDKAAEAPAEAEAAALAPAAAVDDAEGNNLAEVEEAVGKLNSRFDDVVAKLEQLASSIKKILHKL